jgi:hypothetical protein
MTISTSKAILRNRETLHADVRYVDVLPVSSSSDPNVLLSRNDQHIHSVTTGASHVYVLGTSCKRKATDDVGARPSKVMRSCLATQANTSTERSDLARLTQFRYQQHKCTSNQQWARVIPPQV